MLAGLGVNASRYPVLWEKTAPRDPRSVDLAWAHRRLEGLRARGVEPIVTLLHHGSGPPYTSLLDEGFAELFATYAGTVAAAFPWVERWTPVNEPLTTARFSTLYGVWYPNRRDDHAAFGRALTNQVFGIVLAMEAIRKRNAAARLVLTEDLQGFVALDPGARAYAEHKQERAFLSIELLQRRVVPGHPLYRYLRDDCGVPRARLAAIAERATPPDLIGWNYYPYSERTLTTRPDGCVVNSATVEAGPHAIAPRPLLRAAFARLGVPFGLAEVHVAAPQSARVRWLVQRYDDLSALRDEGLPVRMLGAWAAFGMVDWASLLVRRERRTEDGIFTYAGADETPQPTAVARAVQRLARGERPPVPSEPGWWEPAATAESAAPLRSRGA